MAFKYTSYLIFRGPYCDTGNCFVVAEVRERQAVSKRAAQKIDTERINVNEAYVKEQYQVTIRNKFAALENLQNSGDINRAWDNKRYFYPAIFFLCLFYCLCSLYKSGKPRILVF
jgi:hypothetical protein